MAGSVSSRICATEAREESKAVSRYPTRVIGPALLSLGLSFLVLGGGIIYLLAPVLLPPILVQNDDPFFTISLQALACVFFGVLLIPAGLIDLKAVHWLLAIGVVLASLLVAFGPTFLLPPEDIPSRP